ncbi:MAG: hypothetical protein K9M94_11350 [Spirochaetia bacterium]|nr:hypothetical protein [Spirochaetia bacterium]
MNINYYLLVFPMEALVASSLDPDSFGSYMALGSNKGSAERLMFFQIKHEFGSFFDWQYAHSIFDKLPEGEVKHSLYLSVYRTLEHIDLGVIGSLFLTTADGKTLRLQQGDYREEYGQQEYYLYQELCPINPLVVSVRNPRELVECMTSPETKVWVPKIVFTDLKAIDFDHPEHTGNIGARYDHNIGHLKDCIDELKANKQKSNKTLDRSHVERFSYQIIDNAIYVGDGKTLLTYPMPSPAELNRDHFLWAKSAGIV